VKPIASPAMSGPAYLGAHISHRVVDAIAVRASRHVWVNVQQPTEAATDVCVLFLNNVLVGMLGHG